MFVIGDRVQVRTTNATGEEFWEDGTIREEDGAIIWVDLESPVPVTTRGGKREIQTVPVAAENLRLAVPLDVVEEVAEEPIPAPPSYAGPPLTRREQANMEAFNHLVRPNGCAMNLLIASILFFVALVIGCIIGIAFT